MFFGDFTSSIITDIYARAQVVIKGTEEQHHYGIG
jgi:hypothetical protein